MLILKDSNNDTCLSEEPKAGWVEISQDEFASILAQRVVVHQVDPASQLAQLDSENTLTQRNLREVIMLVTRAISTLNPGLDLTQIPGVAKVFEVEAQATALRAKL